MVVREKQSRNLRKRNPQLIDSLHSTPAGIDAELFGSNFYERAGSEAIHSRGRRPGSQKSNPKKISRGLGHEFTITGALTVLQKRIPIGFARTNTSSCNRTYFATNGN